MNSYTLKFVDKAGQKDLKIELLPVKKTALILRAFNHKLRQQILLLINENEHITVTEIYVKLRIEQAVASQHLSVLRKAGFVKTERTGKYVHYSVNLNRLEELSLLSEFFNR